MKQALALGIGELSKKPKVQSQGPSEQEHSKGPVTALREHQGTAPFRAARLILILLANNPKLS